MLHVYSPPDLTDSIPVLAGGFAERSAVRISEELGPFAPFSPKGRLDPVNERAESDFTACFLGKAFLNGIGQYGQR